MRMGVTLMELTLILKGMLYFIVTQNINSYLKLACTMITKNKNDLSHF